MSLPRRSSTPFDPESTPDSTESIAVRAACSDGTSRPIADDDNDGRVMSPTAPAEPVIFAAAWSATASPLAVLPPLSASGSRRLSRGAAGAAGDPSGTPALSLSPLAGKSAPAAPGRVQAQRRCAVAKASRRPSAGPSSASASATSSSPSSPSSPSAPPRIVFGPGTVARLPTELGRMHLSSPLIVSSPSRIALARRIQALIPNLDSRLLDSAVVNMPAWVVDSALDRIHGRDVVISVGGESAVGLAKAIGCLKGIPHICIPTTYSGSEMMPLLLDAGPARHSSSSSGSSSGKRHVRHGQRCSRRKTSGNTSTVRDPKVLPTVIIYDEELTMSAPWRFSAPSDTAALARSAEFGACPSMSDDTAQWSYIHLPGV